VRFFSSVLLLSSPTGRVLRNPSLLATAEQVDQEGKGKRSGPTAKFSGYSPT